MLRNKVDDFIQTRVCRVCLIWKENCLIVKWHTGVLVLKIRNLL